ncbi:hypothetical protein [Thalassomonas actiniarum]|uniref:Lipoprotein n=1 Tax=Thalassomonas actiniarum TaxID=485447 RepID=A0AAE9YNC9_9GAMM|nr:hypothetical protein [Thalassomonas actiniarum]WDD97259.1 hypothetical protein SG35_018175 [Thalassomonas actiniarum]
MYKIFPALSPVFILMFSFVFSLLAGCQPADKKSPVNVEPQCLAQQSECVVRTPGGDFRVLFNVDKVLTETPFEVTVEYQGKQSVKNISGYLEGRDMFMGKIPLFLTGQSEHQYLAEVMLGSCAQPSMIWRLWLTAEFAGQVADGESHSGNKQQFFIDFPSSNE